MAGELLLVDLRGEIVTEVAFFVEAARKPPEDFRQEGGLFVECAGGKGGTKDDASNIISRPVFAVGDRHVGLVDRVFQPVLVPGEALMQRGSGRDGDVLQREGLWDFLRLCGTGRHYGSGHS